MASVATTVRVRPAQRDRLKEIRDEEDLPSMDAALREVLDRNSG